MKFGRGWGWMEKGWVYSKARSLQLKDPTETDRDHYANWRISVREILCAGRLSTEYEEGFNFTRVSWLTFLLLQLNLKMCLLCMISKRFIRGCLGRVCFISFAEKMIRQKNFGRKEKCCGIYKAHLLLRIFHQCADPRISKRSEIFIWLRSSEHC